MPYRLPPKAARRVLLEGYRPRIVEALKRHQVERVILFGSLARGGLGSASDIDLVVVRRTNAPFVRRADELLPALPHPRDEGGRWLRQAEHDLDDARFVAGGKRYDSLACFMAQQSAEKALKGYLYSRGAEAVWRHSAAELCQGWRTAGRPSL